MKFYFHVRDIDGYEKDLEGVDLPSLSIALDEARQAAREMVAELVLQHEKVDDRMFEIANDEVDVVGTVAFKDVIGLD
ncbi:MULTISPECIES: DUF6894 family protein [unclassified Rhizobium]|uniref:DUF6894 family protein n=1 Tax=unclassified Rhizobium TaxID=2613769 RepID=UPI003807C1D5